MPTITANGATLYFEDGGRGPQSVLLLPGSGAPLESWAAYRPALETRARVIAMDHRGVGRSTSTPDRWTVLDMANDAIAVLDHLDIASTAVVGMSLGGAVAQELALRHPHRVEKLVLISTVAQTGDDSGPYLRASWELMDALDDAGLQQHRPLLMILTMAARTTLMDEDFVRRFMTMARDVYIPDGQVAAMRSFHSLERLPRLSVPTRVIVGSDDLTAMPRQAALIANAIPGARLTIVPDAGHLILHERVDEIRRLLDHELFDAGKDFELQSDIHQNFRARPTSDGVREGTPSSRRTASWCDASMVEAFDTLVDEAAEVSIEGWDFSWLDGRATEERPSWGYQRLLSQKLTTATAALDIQTGGGEVLAGAGVESFPSTLVATEGWPPNAAKATALLHPLGAVVVTDSEEPPLPFADGAFDLVTSRHPATVHWTEIARVFAPGGTYFAQHVGSGANVEISEYFLGPFEPGTRRHHDIEAEQAEAAALEIVQCKNERLQLEFFDVGAMVFFLRKVVWTVPDFTVDRYRDRLKALHDQIERDGVFRSTTSRHPLRSAQARDLVSTRCGTSAVPPHRGHVDNVRLEVAKSETHGPQEELRLLAASRCGVLFAQLRSAADLVAEVEEVDPRVVGERSLAV